MGEASFALYMVHEMILRYGRVVLTKFGFEIHWALYIPWLILVFTVIQSWPSSSTSASKYPCRTKAAVG